MSSSITVLCNMQRLEANGGNVVLNDDWLKCGKRVSVLTPNLLLEGEKYCLLHMWQLHLVNEVAGVFGDMMTVKAFLPSLNLNYVCVIVAENSKHIKVDVSGKSYSCSLNLHYL